MSWLFARKKKKKNPNNWKQTNKKVMEPSGGRITTLTIKFHNISLADEG